MALRKLIDDYVLPQGNRVPQSLAGVIPTTQAQANQAMAVTVPRSVPPPAPTVGPLKTGYVAVSPPPAPPSPTGGARPGEELLRPAADSAANLLAAQQKPPPPQPTPAAANYSTQYDDSGFAAALAALSGGVQLPPSIMDQLMQQLGPAVNMPTRDLNKEAQTSIDLKYTPQEDAIKQAMTQLGLNYNQAVGAQQGYGQKADTALKQIYDALQTSMGAGQTRASGYYDQAKGQTGSAYDQAIESLAGLNQGIVNQLGGEASALGIEAGSRDPLARILRNYGSQQGAQITGKANALANLNTSGANTLALGEQQMGSAARQGAQSRSDVATQVLQSLSNLGLANAQSKNEYLNQQTELAKMKPLELQQTLAGLQQAQYEQQRQARQDRLGEMTGLGNLDLGQQRNFLTAQGQNLDLKKSTASLLGQQATSKNTFNLEQAKATNPLDLAIKNAQLSNLGLTGQKTTAEINALNNPQARPTSTTRYADKMQSFLDSPANGLWGSSAGPNFRGMVQSIVSTADSAITGSGKSVTDPYQYALQLIDSSPDVAKYGLNKDGLKKALSLYYTGK